jgi:Ca-activated chloride channel family protein
MFNPRAYENTRPDGIAVLELVAGAAAPGRRAVEDAPPPERERALPHIQPLIERPVQPAWPVSPEPPLRQFVPLKRSVLAGEITGPLASLRLTQVFGFGPDVERDGLMGPVEALYRFPLPGDAAVTGVLVRFGEVVVEAALEARGQAEAEYDAARREGRQATLLTRESPDVFTLRLAGITFDQDVAVETSYVQLARAERTGWTLRVPLTTAPRYVRGNEAGTRHAQGQPGFVLRDPGHRFRLDVTAHGAAEVTSPTHPLSVERSGADGDCLRVALAGGEVLPDRDLVLSWQPLQETARPAARVWLHDEPASDQVYFLAMVTPPHAPAPDAGRPRELIVLVDHSGSMAGSKWAAADWAVKQFLAELDERERFTLGVFHNTTTWFATQPCPATMEAVAQAYRFLDAHRDSGGTELGVALEQALSLRRVEGEYARHVVVITDAQVTDTHRILRLAEQEARRADRRRISVLCIDAAPNSFLALELAERGGGVARFLTSAADEEDIATALDELLAEWARPVATDLRLTVNRRQVETAGRRTVPAGSDDTSDAAIDLGDLPAGRSVWVAGRVPRADVHDLRFSLAAAGENQRPALLKPAAGPAHQPALKALFGAQRLLALEHLAGARYDRRELRSRLAALGYDADRVLAGAERHLARLYPENAGWEHEQALRDLLRREALAFGLPSSETAFVATRKERGKLVERTVVVGNALPAGWSEPAYSLATAPAKASFASRLAPPLASDAADAGVFGALAAPAGSAPAGGGGAPDERWHMAAPTAAAPVAPRRHDYPGAHVPGLGRSSAIVFAGAPRLQDGAAVLYDSERAGACPLPDMVTFTLLRVRFLAGAPDAGAVDRRLRLLIFVDDLASPRAQVLLADLLRQHGERPLNLRRRPGEPVRIVLLDPTGAWAAGAPALEISLGW